MTKNHHHIDYCPACLEDDPEAPCLDCRVCIDCRPVRGASGRCEDCADERAQQALNIFLRASGLRRKEVRDGR